MRCFLALPVPEMVAERLADLSGRLRTGHRVPVENMHLTLAFLGEQTPQTLEELHFGLERIRAPAVPVAFGPLGTFGDVPASIHAEVKAGPALEVLHRSVLGAVHAAGITLERRRFRPHVTIAHLPRRLAGADMELVARFLGAFAAASLPGFTAETFVLYRSWIRPDGPIYEELSDYPLG